MKVLDAFLTPGKEHGRPGNKITPEGIAIHYVGNPGSSASGNSNYFENGSGRLHSSAHYIIDLDGTVLMLIPENEQANHAGKYYGPPGTPEMAKTNNIRYIGIECCHPDAGGEFSAKTRAALVELCYDICQRRGFNPRKDIVRHYDITGKECPRFYVRNPKAWEALIEKIAVACGESKTVDVYFPGGTTIVPAVFKDDTWWLTLADGTQVKARDVLAALGYGVTWVSTENTIVATKKEA